MGGVLNRQTLLTGAMDMILWRSMFTQVIKTKYQALELLFTLAIKYDMNTFVSAYIR